MDLSLEKNLPNWLTPERIEYYKNELSKAKPYTDEEYKNVVDKMYFDEPYIDDRMEAYEAQKILKKYGII